MVYDLSLIGDDRMVGDVTPTDLPTDGWMDWTETKRGKVSPHRGIGHVSKLPHARGQVMYINEEMSVRRSCDRCVVLPALFLGGSVPCNVYMT
jgi:hypothetical protein